MEKENTRISRLIREFLRIAFTPEPGMPLNQHVIDISDVMADVIMELHVNISLQGLHVVGDYVKASQVMADRRILRHIFHTLLSNAIKFTPKNGTITVNVQKNKKEYIISIANNGEPIPAEEQSNIYTQNGRTEFARKTDPDGTGLGLYLMKSIVEESSGKTWFTSNPGEDVIFYVSYPLSGMSQKK